MQKLFISLLFLFSFSSFAGSTGYIFEGKTYYLFKDGEKVNELPSEGNSRAPASINDSDRSSKSMILYFTEDELVRCYYWGDKNQKSNKKDSNIHCIKKSEIKE